MKDRLLEFVMAYFLVLAACYSSLYLYRVLAEDSVTALHVSQLDAGKGIMLTVQDKAACGC